MSYSHFDYKKLVLCGIKLRESTLNTCFVFGKCQAGKTRISIRLITNVFEKDHADELESKPDKVLVFVMTNATEKEPQKQYYSRIIEEYSDLDGYFDPKNIQTIDNINRIDFTKNACIVCRHHITDENKFIAKLQDHAENYGRFVVVLDEMEQGQENGVYKRIEFVQKVYDATKAVSPYMKVILSTTTLQNYKASINKIATTANIRKMPILKKFIREPYTLFPVIEDDTYNSIDDFMDGERVILIDSDDPLPNETPEQYRERRIYEEINAIPRKNKRYGYAVISNEIKYHTYQCKRVIRDCGFDFSIALNSDKPGVYNCYYKPIDVERIENDDQIKMFPICYDKLKRMAERGDLSTMMGYHGHVSTGINSSTDFDITAIMTSIYYPMQLLSELNRINKYWCLRSAIKFPKDFPLGDDSCGMLCGGRKFDRGMTYQDPSVNTVFTMGAVLSTSKDEDTTNGAKDAQRHGRMCGRVKQSYENLGITPLFITEKSVLENILICNKGIEEMFKILFPHNPEVIERFKQGLPCNLMIRNVHKFYPDSLNDRVAKEQKKRVKDYADNLNAETHTAAEEFEGDEEYHEMPDDEPVNEGEVPDEVPEGEVPNGNAKPDDEAAGPSGSRENDDDDDDENDDDESASESNDNEQTELTKEQTEVKVDIDDDFIAKLTKHYRRNSKFVPKALRILKELEKAISIHEFTLEMREMGYNEKIGKLLYSIKNARNKYLGYWNYSVAGDGWIFMPNRIKDVLNAL
jgi:hypothetical protein